MDGPSRFARVTALGCEASDVVVQVRGRLGLEEWVTGSVEPAVYSAGKFGVGVEVAVGVTGPAAHPDRI